MGRQQELLEAVVATGTPVVLVVVSGRPLAIEWAASHCAAVMLAWVPGDAGPDAIADALVGDVNPGGRLPISIPRHVGQVPVSYRHHPTGGRSTWKGDYVDGPTTPLWPFGFGRSYTTFELSNLRLDRTEVPTDDGEIVVTVDVTNTGRPARATRWSSSTSAMWRRRSPGPVLELRGFRRVRAGARRAADGVVPARVGAARLRGRRLPAGRRARRDPGLRGELVRRPAAGRRVRARRAGRSTWSSATAISPDHALPDATVGHRPVRHDRRRRRSAVRIVRGAHGPGDLRRDLRAGPSDRRRATAGDGDVVELVRELGVTLVRYPGGNFVSGYDWEDGVGPRGSRPTRLDLAWRSIEPNAVGTDEFIAWARLAGVGADARGQPGHARRRRGAGNLVEYCNGPARQPLRRPARRQRPPRAVRRPAVVPGQRDGRPVADRPQDRDRVRAAGGRGGQGDAPGRPVDRARAPCGSSGSRMPTFGAWEDTVLDLAWEVTDHISLHSYYDPAAYETLGDYLACSARPRADDRVGRGDRRRRCAAEGQPQADRPERGRVECVAPGRAPVPR